MKKILLFICVFLCFCVLTDTSHASAKRDFDRIEELYLREDYVGAQKKIDRFLKEYKGGRQLRKVKEYQDAIERKLCLLEEVEHNVEISNRSEYIEIIEEDPEYYIVQVGAFVSHKNASKQARAVKRKGFDVVLLKVTTPSKIYYRVRAGKFKNEDNAKGLVRKLRSRGFNADIVEQ